VKQEIDKIFNSIEEKPLFYIESGSRLWGIASPDSDYDVRGFHIKSKQQYYDFRKHRDIIEVMDGDFDFVSYDIDKMFGLLAKSNPTVFEWVRADIIYLNTLPDWKIFQQQVVSNFDFKSLFHHYLSLAKGNISLMETGRKFTYKTAFYCIRGLLSAELASKKIVPALLISDLFNQFNDNNAVLIIAKESLERKREKKEKEEVQESDKATILFAIKDYTLLLEKNVLEKSNNPLELEKVLRDYSFNLKTHFYK